ncbi:MAG TPA: NHLP bacteriocin system secretion protein [Kofleriaceae bacterium]|nr:NHLP bacteriocin system secretion protein [Kofleriaceae bacterium]
MNVFRKVSLDRLSSPEQLDQLMQVTDARGWIMLAAFSTILAIAVLWGVLGSVEQDVPCSGMLVKSGGVFEVSALSNGRITDLAVRVGDIVTEGQVVARMSQPDLANKLLEARAVLTELKTQHEEIAAHGSKDVALQTRLLAQQRATISQTIAASQRSAKAYRETDELQAKLVAEGLLTRQTELATRHQLDQTAQQIGDAQSQLGQLAVQEQTLRAKHEEEINASRAKIAAQERVVAVIERDTKANAEVVSQHTGRILEIIADQGTLVAAGDPIVTLDLTGRTVKELEVVLYVPSSYGKQIQVGMTAYISPSTVKREEFGLMVGRITYVSDYPATSRGMLRVLKNDKLLTSLVGTDSPYEVHADLFVDEHTVSGYRWSSSHGPPLKIQSGTRAAAYIAVESKRPIEMVIPLLRKLSGI